MANRNDKGEAKMQTYRVSYYTLSKGREYSNAPGNIRQFNSVAYIQCDDTTRVKFLLEYFYVKPLQGNFYYPVIESITAVKGDCIIQPEESEND